MWGGNVPGAPTFLILWFKQLSHLLPVRFPRCSSLWNLAWPWVLLHNWCLILLVTKYVAGKIMNTGNRAKGLPPLCWSNRFSMFWASVLCEGCFLCIIKLLAHWKLFLIYLLGPLCPISILCTVQTFRKYLWIWNIKLCISFEKLHNQFYCTPDLWKYFSSSLLSHRVSVS